jgi:hypothetical protein
MNKVNHILLEIVFPFIVVHALILGLFSVMAYLTVELLFPTTWAPKMF